jgi:hypothetical protein
MDRIFGEDEDHHIWKKNFGHHRRHHDLDDLDSLDHRFDDN